ncbi:MAG: AAA family ATPase [Chloroflexota bacterium]
MIPNEPTKLIAYGTGDIRRMRVKNGYYVDKTHYIPLFEAAPDYVFLIRPRRMGKTLWLTTIQRYYDVNYKDKFEWLFGDTYIGQNPTPERNSFLMITLNFANVNPDLRKIEESFESNGRNEIDSFVRRYRAYFEDSQKEDILAGINLTDCLQRIFYAADENDLKIFLLIDEYDNFANTVLVAEGQEAYHNLTHGPGFFRFFFNLLKGATGGQIAGLTRLYITGVSPVTMDDVTSGFNIGDNISLDPQFNELMGFSEEEVRTICTYYRDARQLVVDVDECLEVMKLWYDNYLFSQRAETRVFNSDMVIYFVKQAIREKDIPLRLIDDNVRIDYGKLRHLMSIDNKLNGNFSILRSIIETGETISTINASFPLDRLLDRNNFISLLYYFGLLTFGEEVEGESVLYIPNFTIRNLMYGYIRDAYRDVDVFRVDIYSFSAFLRAMAFRGDWKPVFQFLSDEIQKQTAVRDYLSAEKVVQGFLLAYLNICDFFLIWSEKDMNSGFVDLYLEPFHARYPGVKYGYLLELEYISRSNFSQTELKKKITEAKGQLKQYASDSRIQALATKVPIKKILLVYNGWELVHQEEWVAPSDS